VEQLRNMGYEYDSYRDTIKAPSRERGIRLGRLGYTDDSINACTERNRKYDPYFIEWDNHRIRQPDKFLLAQLERELDYEIEHSHSTYTVLLDVLFYMLIMLFKIMEENSDVLLFSPELRAAEKDIRDYIDDYNFLFHNEIQTMAELETNIASNEERISRLETERQKLSNRIRRPKSPEELAQNKMLRKDVKHAKRIRDKSPHLYKLLKLEHELESREIHRIREGSYER